MRPSVITPASPRALAAAFLAATAAWATLDHLQAGTGGGYSTSIAEREVIRRQQRISQAAEEEAAGDRAYSDRDYEAALSHYRSALTLLPDAEVVREERQRVIGKFNDTAVRLAEQRAETGEYDASRSLLNEALAYDPGHRGALKLLRRLDDPEWYNPANSKDHTSNVQEVRKRLQLSEGYYDLGDYDKSSEEAYRALAVDRYNTAARRMLERNERKISEYHLSSRDHTRARMLRQVDEQWETPVPAALTGETGGVFDIGGGTIDNSQVIIDKLKSIILPSVNLDQAPVDEAIDYLRDRARELDTSPGEKGVNIVLRRPEAGPVPRISGLVLNNVPLEVALKTVAEQAGLRMRIDQYAVIISPLDSDGDLHTRVFKVPPDFLSLGGTTSGGDSGGSDPFGGGSGSGSSLNTPRATAKEILEQAGITFPEAASAFFSSANSTLTVRNTPANLDLVANFVESLRSQVVKMIDITAKFIEVNQKNTDEFGFDWLMGAFNIGGNRVFGSGGTAGNRAAGPVGASAWPFVPPGQGSSALPVGGSNLLTGGLRFGDNAISNNAIDGLLTANTTAEGTPESSVSPAVFALAGVYTDPQFQVVLRALNQKKGTDLLTAPKVTTRSGQRAKVEVIREFIYPTEFEPPEIPQDFGGNNGGFSLFGGGAPTNTFPVTPTTPTTFETKNTGVTLEVEPVVGPDGQTVDLSLSPEVVEFEGFVNYGSPIQTTSADALGNPVTLVLTENRIEQPVFSSRKLSTNVTIYDGMTIGVGGLIREDVQTVEDKVPIFGDLPYLGRLFRTKADQFFKKNLMMFVTVNLILPSGEKVRATRTPAPPEPTTDLLPPPPPEVGNYK